MHYVEHKSNRANFSYLRYLATIALVILLASVIAKIGWFEKKHWLLDLLPMTLSLMCVYLTIKVLFKKKGISFIDNDKKG